MLYYFPLEPYAERYTSLMSCKDGWAERHFTENRVPFVRIEGKNTSDRITCGWVLDAVGRSIYSMSQVEEFLLLVNEGKVKDGDVVFLEDFWHLGAEALFYVRHLTGVKFKIGTFCHAQSVDRSDFSHAMKLWMRPIEQGFGVGYDYIFTCSHILKELLIAAGIGTEETIFQTGLPYNSAVLLEQVHKMGVSENAEKEPYVIFTSRFDDEKDPMFFLDLVEECKEVKFKLVKPRELLSHNEDVVRRVNEIVSREGTNLQLVDTSRKVDYYRALAHAKVQFNCAIQDWVSWTLLEAITFNALPLYPIWKDFPYELHGDIRFLYERKDLKDAASRIRFLMSADAKEHERMILDCADIVKKHDASWKKELQIMNLIK